MRATRYRFRCAFPRTQGPSRISPLLSPSEPVSPLAFPEISLPWAPSP